MSKKIKRNLGCILLIAFLFMPEMISHAGGAVMMYALEKVNVRSGPGTEYDSMGKLEAGEKVFAVELTEEGWYRIVFEGENGYVRQDFLEVYESENGLSIEQPDLPDEQPEEDNAVQGEEAPVEETTVETVKGEKSDTDTDKQMIDEPEKTLENASTVNPATAMIFLAVILIIAGYAVVVIWKEKKNPSADALEKGNEKNDDFTENEVEVDEQTKTEFATDSETIAEEDSKTEEFEILDFDEEQKL